jgi:hypothetical protein
MELVLDLYTSEHPPEEPLICMDEAAIELHKDVYPPQPMQPGCDLKEDYHYDRGCCVTTLTLTILLRSMKHLMPMKRIV